MRILLTADTVGGVWDYACTLARSLDDDGHEVLLAVLGEVGERQRQVPSGVEVAAHRFRLEWMPESDRDVVASTAWLERLARLWNPDVVHANQFSAASGSFEAPTVLVAHSDVLSWFSEARGVAPGPEWRKYAERVRSSLHRATAVVSPTGYQSRLLQRHYGRAADRVIHNGVAPPGSPAPADPDTIVLCAARAWDEAKGVDTLNAAAARLGSAAPAIHLLGSTTSPGGECVDAPHLHCHGAVDRPVVDAWMDRAAVYVAPSRYEPFGLAPLEAALHGCALVLSDIGSLRELWDGCAAFFPAGDAEALAKALTSVVNDPQLLSRRRKAAMQRALRRYTAERMYGEYLALYSEIAAVPRAPAVAGPVRQTA